MGSDAVTVAELVRMVEVVGRAESPNGMGGGSEGSSRSAVTVMVGVAVTTIVVVMEPSTISTVAMMTPAEGVTVTVAVDATVRLVVSVTI